jgi:HSP20 family protein
MFLTRWNRAESPTRTNFEQLFDLRDELDRLFETPFGELGRASRLFNNWAPAVDLYEDKDSFIVKAELPGMKREDIEVSLHEGMLTLAGERKSEEKTDNADTHRTERFFGRFQRSLTLPKAVKTDKVAAQYRDGVLTVTLPKSEEVKPKQIEVNVK